MVLSKFRLPLLAAALLAAMLSTATSIAQSQPPEAATAPVKIYGASKPIPDRYIITFKRSVPDVAAEAKRLMAGRGGEIHFVYTRAIKGFAATIPPQAVKAIASNPWVESIEQDATVSIQATQSNATWGLDRIDQRGLPLDSSYTYVPTGAGVYAYIVDTGIRASHSDFGGRVSSQGFTAISDGRGTNDCDGHGTHVAGTVGSTTYGVAKDITLIPVRVLDCRGSGSWTGVIAGLDYVANDTSRRPAVANMSLGGGRSSSVNAAVAGAVRAGVTVAVAAGNETTDACTTSPASEPTAITVGATTISDARASYSNFGKCLDVFAPGSGITSTWNTGDGATNTISGTSMAAPHVAGVAALASQSLASGSAPTYDANFVNAVTQRVISTASVSKVSSAGSGSPNLLLYSPLDSTDPGSGSGGGGGSTLTTPVTPSNLAASAASKSRINLSWSDNSNNESGFYIYISTNGTSWSKLPGSTTSTNAAVTGLRSRTTYYFQVSAFATDGTTTVESARSATASARTF